MVITLIRTTLSPADMLTKCTNREQQRKANKKLNFLLIYIDTYNVISRRYANKVYKQGTTTKSKQKTEIFVNLSLLSEMLRCEKIL